MLLYVTFTVVSEYAIVIRVRLLVFLLSFEEVYDTLFGQYMFSPFEYIMVSRYFRKNVFNKYKFSRIFPFQQCMHNNVV